MTRTAGEPRLTRRQMALAVTGAVALVGGSSLARRYAKSHRESLAVLEPHASPRPAPALRFADATGRARSLADFRGRTVLLNVWATWCPPCRAEMPALDRLQAALGDTSFDVVAVSIDAEGLPAVRAFFRSNRIVHLQAYVDAFHELVALGAAGVPLSLLVDRDGREVARKLGPAAWDDPAVIRTIRGFLTEERG